jgi:hypothetical protein
MINHYFALLNAEGECRVTLSAPQWGTSIAEDGTITAPRDRCWEGPPPPWCHQIVEVRSPEPWYKVPSDHKTIIWRRDA